MMLETNSNLNTGINSFLLQDLLTLTVTFSRIIVKVAILSFLLLITKSQMMPYKLLKAWLADFPACKFRVSLNPKHHTELHEYDAPNSNC